MSIHPAFAQIAHRPWPLPAGRWAWRQSWRDLLFAHWPAPVEAVRRLVPPGLEIDTFDGATWVGVVPFRMAGVMRRPLPDLPWVSAFPELNVRVYVTAGGKPGVWFLSLDATNPLAVAAARALFYLPYYRADIDITPEGEGVAYRCLRRRTTAGVESASSDADGRGRRAVQSASSDADGWERRAVESASSDADGRERRASEEAHSAQARSAGAAGVFQAHYRPTSPIYAAAPGTLEHWLTERYCLYAQAPDGTLYRTEVHHRQWPLQRAAAEITANTIAAAGGLPVAGPPVQLHFARRIDVVVWAPERIRN